MEQTAPHQSNSSLMLSDENSTTGFTFSSLLLDKVTCFLRLSTCRRRSISLRSRSEFKRTGIWQKKEGTTNFKWNICLKIKCQFPSLRAVTVDSNSPTALGEPPQPQSLTVTWQLCHMHVYWTSWKEHVLPVAILLASIHICLAALIDCILSHFLSSCLVTTFLSAWVLHFICFHLRTPSSSYSYSSHGVGYGQGRGFGRPWAKCAK